MALALLALAACGGESSGTTSEIEDCLWAAGAEQATEASDLRFADANSADSVSDHGRLDSSGQLSVGTYEAPGKGDWKIYYVARKGYRVSLNVLLRDPSKAAKVIAYVHPADTPTIRSADACL
ncbi:MAG: hypothetical protein R2725_04535 [Solirubrobacterales bacterium]